MPTLEIPNSGTGANLPTTSLGGDTSTREKAKDAQTYDVEDSESEPKSDKEAADGAVTVKSLMIAHLHQMFSERLDTMQSMVERLPGVAPPIRKTNPDSYTDTPYTDEITLIEMHMRFSFPSIKASIASFAVLSDKFVEQFAISRDLEKTSDSLYEFLQHQVEPLRGYIARFNQEKVVIPECSFPTAISAFKRGLLPDWDLYKELTKYQCKTMEDVLSRAWEQVKWEEEVASRAKAQRKQDPKTIRPDQAKRYEKPSQRPARDSRNRNQRRYKNRPIEKAEGMAVSTWPNISHLSVSRPELINVLRQMGQHVKWPQKMKAPDSFRSPGFWCDFHRDHSYKTEDCVTLKIEVNKLLKKGYLREFLSENAKSYLSKETTAAKKSTWNAKHGLVAAKPKMSAPRNGRNKLHGQGAGESSHPTSRRPGHIAHRSELPGKKDTGR
ncbi:hypothetical protein DY000_02016207 [Brassica cretica]|uniref:Retrotransposon gag domain-containing protein n=1 Tax=Brassica cretica TaxID=69181 RepID=A0ABQ7CPW2_BRACR|nr:hypothetical protein DY000_02016207 [Brassica cretica]